MPSHLLHRDTSIRHQPKPLTKAPPSPPWIPTYKSIELKPFCLRHDDTTTVSDGLSVSIRDIYTILLSQWLRNALFEKRQFKNRLKYFTTSIVLLASRFNNSWHARTEKSREFFRNTGECSLQYLLRSLWQDLKNPCFFRGTPSIPISTLICYKERIAKCSVAGCHQKEKCFYSIGRAYRFGFGRCEFSGEGARVKMVWEYGVRVKVVHFWATSIFIFIDTAFKHWAYSAVFKQMFFISTSGEPPVNRIGLRALG